MRISFRRALPFIGALAAMNCCIPASLAQDASEAIERNALRRQQQSDAFALRSRQAAEETRAQSTDRETQAALRALHAEQRRQQDALHADQLHRLQRSDALPDTPSQRAAERAERARMEQESAAQLRHFDAQRSPGSPPRKR